MPSLSALGALTNLTRLLQPPPLSQLHSRIRSNVLALPDAPLTTAVVLAMLDLVHDRLQRIRPHPSEWPAMREAILGLLRAGDWDDFTDYYAPSSAVATEWKDIHPGHCPIRTEVVDYALRTAGPPRNPTLVRVGHTRPSPALDQCLDNLQAEGVIRPNPSPLPPTMTLF